MLRAILCNRCEAFIDCSPPTVPLVHTGPSEYVSSSQEISEMQAAMLEDETMLDRYDEEIFRLKKALGVLEVHRSALKQRIREKRSLISPVRRIPPELLDYIFTFIHDSYDYSLNLSKWNHTPSASTILPLSQVSSQWRRAVVSRPKLWSSFFIDASSIQTERRNLIRTHLRNAGTHPLNVLIRNSGTPTSAFANDALWMILLELHRCAELRFRVDWSMLDEPLLAHRLPRLVFPQLRSFGDSSSWNAEESTAFSWVWKALWQAPNLVQLDTNQFHNPMIFPYQRLNKIRLENLEAHQILRIVRAMPNLKSLEMGQLAILVSDEPEFWTVMTPLVCSSLQEMIIDVSRCFESDPSITRLCSLFEIPALERLEMKASDIDIYPKNPRLPSSFFTMIQHSSSSLQEVVWKSTLVCLPRTFYMDILRSLPNLRYFQGSNTCLGDEAEGADHAEYVLHLIKSLTITASSSERILVPKLAELHLTECESRMTIDYAIEFLNMVESRSTSGLNAVVARLANAELAYATCEMDLLDPNHISICENQSWVEERIGRLAENDIQCTIHECEGWPWV